MVNSSPSFLSDPRPNKFFFLCQNEISGYIDYAHRLKTEDFRLYFDGKKKLLPKTTDLSYFNWRTNACYANDSPNFKVDASNGN